MMSDIHAVELDKESVVWLSLERMLLTLQNSIVTLFIFRKVHEPSVQLRNSADTDGCLFEDDRLNIIKEELLFVILVCTLINCQLDSRNSIPLISIVGR